MPIIDLILPEYDAETRITRTVMERVPDVHPKDSKMASRASRSTRLAKAA